MPFLTKRRSAILASLGCTCLALGVAAAWKLSRDLGRALQAPSGDTAPLRLVPLAGARGPVLCWGGGEVEAVAAGPGGLTWAGGFGVRDDGGSLSGDLPTPRATALGSWRGRPVAALAAGGVFLRRDGHWEELAGGFGTLHARTLAETAGGELLVGAREGLYRAAWGGTRMDRLDPHPVRSLALEAGGALLAAGEEGLRRVGPGQATLLATPDPWVDWVGSLPGAAGSELVVVTPLGLARGPAAGPLLPVAGGEAVNSAAVAEGRLYALAAGRLLRFGGDRPGGEEPLPGRPRKLIGATGASAQDGRQGGVPLFVDTDRGLYQRSAGGWVLARPPAAALPPGSAHVGALAFLGQRLVVGSFDGGLAVGTPKGTDWSWAAVPGSQAWGVNALLPAGGQLLIASLRGAARFDGDRIAALPGDTAGAAFSLAPTRDGVAIGYGQGVLLPGSRFLSAFHGLPGNQALALAAGDFLYVGTPSGLGAVAGSRVAWRVTAGEGRLPHPWITALAFHGPDLFVGTYGGGLARMAGGAPSGAPVAPGTMRSAPGSFTPYPETEGLKINTGCLVEAGGRLYAGTDGRGLYRLDADGSRFQALKLRLPSPRVTALLPAPDALYVGTDEGLARLPLPIREEEP
jgi:hypothetical protein